MQSPSLRLESAIASWKAANSFGFCPLAYLYAAWERGESIGQFHDLLRKLVKSGRVRLHPWTQAMYQIPEGQECYWLLSGQEIKAYVELL